jgi:hypothetical protein
MYLILFPVDGFIGATKYLLDQGVSPILSNVFCQDPIENHFGRHRGLGFRSVNPSLHEFGYVGAVSNHMNLSLE